MFKRNLQSDKLFSKLDNMILESVYDLISWFHNHKFRFKIRLQVAQSGFIYQLNFFPEPNNYITLNTIPEVYFLIISRGFYSVY